MIVLAIETSTLTGSVALLECERLLGEITLSVSIQHSESLMPAIDQLLKNTQKSISDVDLFAVSHGPGSFTGLRIGIAVGQGFSAANHKPLIGISSLETLAYSLHSFSGIIVPVINAFRGEVFRGFYRADGKSLKALKPDAVMSPTASLEELSSQSESCLLVGNGVTLLPEASQKLQIAPDLFHVPRAAAVGVLAKQKWAQKADASEPVLPVYLRQPG